jgi:hypothetical protein
MAISLKDVEMVLLVCGRVSKTIRKGAKRELYIRT